ATIQRLRSSRAPSGDGRADRACPELVEGSVGAPPGCRTALGGTAEGGRLYVGFRGGWTCLGGGGCWWILLAVAGRTKADGEGFHPAGRFRQHHRRHGVRRDAEAGA